MQDDNSFIMKIYAMNRPGRGKKSTKIESLFSINYLKILYN